MSALASVRFLVADGFNLIRRIFEARQGASDDLSEVIAACRASLRRALLAHKPSHAAVVLEHHDATWRHLLYPDYKADRPPPPAALLDGLPQFTEAFADEGVKTTAAHNYEADDVIATLASGVAARQGKVIILSTDKLFLQLLAPGIEIIDHFNNKKLDSEHVKARYGVSVESFVDYLALVGDRSVNLKGVPGIGDKAARQLLERFGSLEQLLASSAVTDDKSLETKRQKVLDSADEANRCRQLCTLKRDVELGDNLRHFRLQSSAGQRQKAEQQRAGQ
ncbi:MAG: 5'-3' exonuclease H3TH domain-containing protein [Pseudomonadales bacterium]